MPAVVGNLGIIAALKAGVPARPVRFFSPSPPANATPPPPPPPTSQQQSSASQQRPSSSQQSQRAASGRTAERIYSIESLRQGARLVLSARRDGATLSALKAATSLGHPSMRSSIGRLVKKAYAKAGDDTARQDAFIDSYEFPAKGSEEFALRRMFDEDELDLFAEVVKYAAVAGFPYDVATAQELLQSVVQREGRIDPVSGTAYAVSRTYVLEWYKSRPDMAALLKSSPLDPARADKANPQVTAEASALALPSPLAPRSSLLAPRSSLLAPRSSLATRSLL